MCKNYLGFPVLIFIFLYHSLQSLAPSSVFHFNLVYREQIERDNTLALNEQDKKGRTLLHYAVENNDVELITTLMQQGGSLDIADFHGETPLDIAKNRMNGNILTLLERHIVARNKTLTFIDSLLMRVERGGEKFSWIRGVTRYSYYMLHINKQDDEGKTLLHYAVEHNDMNLVKILFKDGACFDIKDHSGKTPLHVAIKMKRNFMLFHIDSSIRDMLKNFSSIRLALVERNFELFIKLYSVGDFSHGILLKLVEIASKQGSPLIVGMISFHLSKVRREKFLKEALKNCCFKKFKEEFSAFCFSKKMNHNLLIEIYILWPQIMGWINFSTMGWDGDSKMKFLKFVTKDNPTSGLTLFSYGDSRSGFWNGCTDFLRQILKSQVSLSSLRCPGEGSALSSLINLRGLGHNASHNDNDDIILDLIERDLGVNEDTPIGKPLNHFLYMFSADIDVQRESVVKSGLLLLQALLGKYEKNDSFIGMSLNPSLAEAMHFGAKASKMGEYMQTPLGSTLAFGSPSKRLYDIVKEVVDLEEVNDHGRNFVHHLAFLKTCLENDLKGLFLKRNYTVGDMKKNIDLQDDDGMTPLMYATRNPQFFKHLLDCEADVYLTDKRGFSVEHHLMIHGTRDVIRTFLKWKNISFFSDDSIKELRFKLGVKMRDCLTLDVPFEEQLKEMSFPKKFFVGHRNDPYPRVAILSTHPFFLDYLQKNFYYNGYESLWNLDLQRNREKRICDQKRLGFLWSAVLSTHSQYSLNIQAGVHSEYYKWRWLNVQHKREEEERKVFNDQKARVTLAAGGASYLYDGPFFVTETYALLDPFHVCEAYGRYAPDFSFSLRSQSVLLDGFKRTFINALKRGKESGRWKPHVFKQQLEERRQVLLMSQEYLVPLLIQQFLEKKGDIDPFLDDLLSFFMENKDGLKVHLKDLLEHMIEKEGSLEMRLSSLIPLIEGDKRGIYFPFCYMLPPHEALLLKDMLLKKMGTLPPLCSDFMNGVYRNMQALMRTSMCWNVGSYLDKLKEHDKKVLEKRMKMESDPKIMTSFQDMFRELSSFQDMPSELELMEKLKVNGRSVSFIHNGEEYILKVRKHNEDMRDHAEIACGLEDKEDDIQENYGCVTYVHLNSYMKKWVHSLILDKGKNPLISLKSEDLTGEAVLFKVRHTRYFEYLSGSQISFKDFKNGLKMTMEQAFKHIRTQGRFMETFSDISHDETRPGIFLPMIFFIDYVNGIFFGTIRDPQGAYRTVDACPRGERDLGNSLKTEIKENMAFSTTYATYLRALYDYMDKEGQTKEKEKMILINNMQEALAHTMMTASNLLLIRLFDHPEELRDMTYQQFIKDLEDVLIEPFIRILGSNESLEKLRPFYWDMLKKDFEDFKAYPYHFEYASSIYRQGDLSRNNYYQSFYRLTYFLMSSMRLFNSGSDSEKSGVSYGVKRMRARYFDGVCMESA